MPDVPHLLKLLRNWLLDTGFILENGSFISCGPIYSLIQQKESLEVSSVFKLTEKHLTVTKTQRQNVRLAAELLSHTVGTALIQYSSGDEGKNVGRFIILMNKWFELMNVFTPKLTIPHKSAFGLFPEEQNQILQDVRGVIQSMKCVGKQNLQVFQKGIIMTTVALPRLLQNVEKYDVKFILTHRLNQDCLKNTFGQLRFRGGLHDHPPPMNAVHRLRLIILGKNPGILQSGMNTLGER
jgi:hypothetical protein